MNLNNFTIKSQEAIQKATEIAAAKQTRSIEVAHLLKGILLIDEIVFRKRVLRRHKCQAAYRRANYTKKSSSVTW